MDPVQALRDRIDSAPRPDPWKVRCARVLRYMTQEQLGIACGWSSVQKEIVNRIEAYAEPIGKLRIAKLAAALNVTPDDLLSSPVEWRPLERPGTFLARTTRGRKPVPRGSGAPVR